jgi:hypothetical protein
VKPAQARARILRCSVGKKPTRVGWAAAHRETRRAAVLYSCSNPLAGSNLRVRLFSVTVRTTLSGAPFGI